MELQDRDEIFHGSIYNTWVQKMFYYIIQNRWSSMINNVLFKIVLNFKDIKLILNLFRQKSAILFRNDKSVNYRQGTQLWIVTISRAYSTFDIGHCFKVSSYSLHTDTLWVKFQSNWTLERKKYALYIVLHRKDSRP